MIRKVFKYRIYPSRAQTETLETTLDLCRDLYNASLQERRDAWKLNCISLNYFTQANQLKDIRKSNLEYTGVYAQVLQDVLKRADRSFQNFFRRVKSKQGKAGFPRFQGKSRYNSFTYTQNGFGLTDNGKLRLSKIGDIKIKLHRPAVGKIKTCTISREGSKWFICFVVKTTDQELPRTGQAIGVDVGIESFATLSDGTQIGNWRYYESAQKKLRVAQRRVARRKKGSSRRNKAVSQLRNIHQKISNQRNDFQHKLSTDLIRQYDLIAVEKLNILGMLKGVLSKQIYDASWSSFFQKLKYKAESAGKKLVEVNPNFTSQDCSGCGTRVKKNLSERQHSCETCGLSIHRDWNAALNILSVGLTDQALTYGVTQSVA